MNQLQAIEALCESNASSQIHNNIKIVSHFGGEQYAIAHKATVSEIQDTHDRAFIAKSVARKADGERA